MPRILFAAFILFTLVCCQNQSTTDAENLEEQSAATPPAATAKPTLPSVPLELLEQIWNEGTQVDVIFYHHPFTLSMSEKPAIQHTVRHIAEDPAPLNPNCQSTGRVTFQIDGNIVLEGDFYFSTGCTYYVFYENQEKKYANYMTTEGINYFNNQIQQATKMQQQMQQQAQ